MAGETFDYIVIGAGAGGSVLADRLSADGKRTVLILESGGPDNDPVIAIPKGLYFLYGGKRHSFYYRSQPTGPQRRVEVWQRGRVDGGSTSINGMQYDRAGRRYWDGIAGDGAPGWGWDTVLPLFLQMENHELGASPSRGAGGPLDIHVSRNPDELTERIFAASEGYGLSRVSDLNDSEGDRVGYMPNTTRRGVRWGAAKAFLDPARQRRNVTYLRHAHVGRITFDGSRATSVTARIKGQVRDFTATGEIVICAGALETPLLLERSGIGRDEVIHSIGVRPISESPEVGEHLVEQRQVAYQASIRPDLGHNRKLSSTLRQLISGAGYLVTRSGVMSTGAYDLGGFAGLLPQSNGSDTFLMMGPFSLDLTATKLSIASHPGFSIVGYPITPETAGSIHSTSADPAAPATLVTNYLEFEWEQQLTLRIIEAARNIASQPSLAEIFSAEELPGDDVTSVAQATGHSWMSGHVSHAVGTARMGIDQSSVVDPELRVRGVEGLRIADASVFPKQPGNTMAPTLAVGARAAQLILDET